MKVKDFLLELLFPEFCLNCKRLGPLLCQNCYHGLQFYFSQNKIKEIENNFPEINFDQLQIMAKFTGSLAKIIKNLKYQNSRNVAPMLAKMLYRHLLIPQTDLITFVPLHPHKLRIRGYNQCQEIALELSKLTKIPVKSLLERTKNTKAQAQIKNQQERLQRMQNVFQVREKHQKLIANKTIIILDDILTTGATANAASEVLKKAHAKQIFVIALASKME